jgi:hypothetical protein
MRGEEILDGWYDGDISGDSDYSCYLATALEFNGCHFRMNYLLAHDRLLTCTSYYWGITVGSIFLIAVFLIAVLHLSVVSLFLT